jgi:hypothetical protein
VSPSLLARRYPHNQDDQQHSAQLNHIDSDPNRTLQHHSSPVTTTITPPPYSGPQTTKGPMLNTKTAAWHPGPPSPSCTAYCGTPCRIFSSDLCPLCLLIIGGPPGARPPGGNGSGNSEDNSSECQIETVNTCFKAYVDYSIEIGSPTLTDYMQLFTCNCQVLYH